MQRQSFRSLARCQAAEQFKSSSSSLPSATSALASLKDFTSLATSTTTNAPSRLLFPQHRRHFTTATTASPPPLLSLTTTTTTTTLPFAARGYAGAQSRGGGIPKGAYAEPGVGAARPSSIRITLVSSNLLAEPYKGEPPALPASAWVSLSGWKERWRRWMHGVKSIYTLAKIRKNVNGWSLPAFKQDALKVYEEACAALAAGDRTALRQLVTPAVFTDMKRQIKAREEGGWKKVEWALSGRPELKDIEVVQGRLIAIDTKDDNTGFAQLTVRFKCSQKFAAFDGKGQMVAGSVGDEIRVDDYWVFERALKQQVSNRWRVAGRLTVPAEGFLPRN